MLRQRRSDLDPATTGDAGRRRPDRFRGDSSHHRRRRPGVECLEDRRLLSAITEFPLPTNTTSGSLTSPLTVGAGGNIWFGVTTSAGGAIDRITPSGAITAFPLPAGYGSPYDLTAG